MISLLKKPSAWLPLAMSSAALAMLVFYLSKYGVVYHEDEGTPAHLFQLLMGGQLPVITFFMFKWLPRYPREGILVLTLQLLAVAAACVPVFFLGF
jgi:hypothetical protein